MKRIIVNEEDFKDKSDSYAGDEKMFENIVKRFLPSILNKHESSVLNFKLIMYSETGGGVAADLILIDKNYAGYAVIEVELDEHSLDRHVFPQITKLANCNYFRNKERIFTHLNKHNKNFSLNKNSFFKMVKNHLPDFYVISNKFNFTWADRLTGMNINYLSVSPFKNKKKEDCLYIKEALGEESYKPYEAEWNYNYFVIYEKSKFLLKINNTQRIFFEGQLFNFLVEDFQDGYYLHPVGAETIDNVHSSKKLGKITTIKYINDDFHLE
tara:strand:+ start:910 stop:1716 length:807 start_codon:yes stop_codon:yes gene_type:complete